MVISGNSPIFSTFSEDFLIAEYPMVAFGHTHLGTYKLHLTSSISGFSDGCSPYTFPNVLLMFHPKEMVTVQVQTMHV